jgi:hypothetical protein
LAEDFSMRFIPAVFIWALILVPACSRPIDETAPTPSPPPPPASRSVAIYDDLGCWQESVTALECMFIWMGLSVTHIDARSIRERGLDDHDLLCLPGG